MAKKEDIRPNQAKAPEEHADREGQSEWGGFQPPAKFSNQGSTPYEPKK